MNETTVETRAGRVRGYLRNKCRSWLGIPYAAIPDGKRRWQPPEPATPWSGIRDAGRYGTPAVQHSSAMGAQIRGGFGDGSEDCLSLNVFAPLAQSELRPVMVWIHGGGFAVGSASQAWYDGETLARENNVLVVTINYRVGVLGFLRLCDVTDGAIASTGNEGLLDQIEALQWVQQNISGFGGDPNNVTVFGESAGAMAIATLCTMPLAAGLIHKAIMQSGSAHAVHDVHQANRVAELFISALPKHSQKDPLTADVPALATAAATLHGRMMFDERLTIMPTRPVVDGTLVPSLPIDAMRHGKAAQIPMIIGWNRDEWRYYVQVDRAMKRLDQDKLIERLCYHFSEDEAAQILMAYDYQPDKSNDAFRVYSEFHGDAAFIVSSRQATAALSAHQPVFQYRYDVTAPGLGGLLGACHVTEIPLVFGTLDAPGHGVLFTNDLENQQTSQAMRQWWASFAETGSPKNGAWANYADQPGQFRINHQPTYAPNTDSKPQQFWATVSDERLMKV